MGRKRKRKKELETEEWLRRKVVSASARASIVLSFFLFDSDIANPLNANLGIFYFKYSVWLDGARLIPYLVSLSPA